MVAPNYCVNQSAGWVANLRIIPRRFPFKILLGCPQVPDSANAQNCKMSQRYRFIDNGDSSTSGLIDEVSLLLLAQHRRHPPASSGIDVDQHVSVPLKLLLLDFTLPKPRKNDRR